MNWISSTIVSAYEAVRAARTLAQVCAGASFDTDRDGWRWYNLWLGQMKSRVSVKNDPNC